MDLATLRIGIVGAGIGGLALAALLAQSGAKVEVIERFDAPQPIGSGLVVQPVGMAVLDRIGIGQAARELGQTITRMEGRTKRKLVLEADYSAGAPGLGMHRATLHHLLWQAMQASGAGVTLAATVTGYRQDGTIRATGSFGESDDFDLLVDASGAGSLLSKIHAKALAFGAVWGTVPWVAASDLPADRLTQRYHQASRMAGILPIGCLPGDPTPLAAVFWSLPANALAHWPDQSAAEFADWKDEVCSFWPEITPFLTTLQNPADMTVARYSHGARNRFYQGRLVFLGDSAHRASPQLGQGANMALLDALSLTRALGLSRDVDEALAFHQKTRNAHIRAYQALSGVLTPMYQSHSNILPGLRDHLLAPVSRLCIVRPLISALVSGTLLPPLRGYDLPPITRKASP